MSVISPTKNKAWRRADRFPVGKFNKVYINAKSRYNLRKVHGISQQDICEQMGMPQSMVSQLEGRINLEFSMLELKGYANAVDVLLKKQSEASE
jgi:predicted transcriptional regulator